MEFHQTRMAAQTLLRERLLLLVAAIAYLLVYNRTVPHGDALRVVSQVQAGQLSWNPNHLLFDPLGYVWSLLLGKIGIQIPVLDGFEIISGIATVVSLVIFHAILVQAGIRHRGIRLIAVVGLFASRSFLSLAVNQYYFMVQMPFLLGALYLGLRYLLPESSARDKNLCVYGMGILTALAATILFSNVLLVVLLGVAVGLMRDRDRTAIRGLNYFQVARLWGAAALVGFPAYVAGYLASGSSAGFLHWLLSYQGESASALTDLYRVHWSFQSITESVARLGYNFFSANILDSAGLGTFLRSMIFREPLEFVPEVFRVSLVIAMTPVVMGLVLVTSAWMVLRVRSDRRATLSLAWILPYLLFNFLWSVGGDHFWVQVLPVIWLAWCFHLQNGNPSFQLPGGKTVTWNRWKIGVSAAAVAILMFVNTVNTVVPVSGKHDAEASRYHALLKDGDLEIVPGWEVVGWMRTGLQKPDVERLLLMNMALQPPGSDRHIGRLPEIVERHLASGQRVIVGRLYDKDHEVNPWYGLKRLGWPREKIQSLLSQYCAVEVGRVEDVVFREIRRCPPAPASAAPR